MPWHVSCNVLKSDKHSTSFLQAHANVSFTFLPEISDQNLTFSMPNNPYAQSQLEDDKPLRIPISFKILKAKIQLS